MAGPRDRAGRPRGAAARPGARTARRATVPAGFDAHRLGVEAAALRAKRRTVTAQLRPDLADRLGPRFGPLFDEWAVEHPKRADTSFRADLDGFESWLYATGHLQRPAPRRRWWRTASLRQPHPVVGSWRVPHHRLGDTGAYAGALDLHGGAQGRQLARRLVDDVEQLDAGPHPGADRHRGREAHLVRGRS